MTGEREEGVVVMLEQIVKQLFKASRLGGVAFAQVWGPKRIILGETGLKSVARKGGADSRFRATAVRGVNADCLSQKLHPG